MLYDQVRVDQGKEPPAFNRLFKGKMIVHRGKREEEETNTQGPWRFYIVRNELENEAYLWEIPCGAEHLRSRASFLLLNVKTGMLYIWHGAKSSSHSQQRARDIANILSKR